MTALAATAVAPEPNPATAPARALVERQLALLTRLADIGMEIAEACGRQAVEAAETRALEIRSPEIRSFEPARDPGLAFARVARAVRMTIALQSRLLKDLAALDRADDIAAASLEDRRRMRLRRLTGQAAEATVAARPSQNRGWGDDLLEDEIETLAEEAYERLTDAEDDDWSGRPYPEVVAAICGDLGLSPDWTDRLLAASAPPGRRNTGPEPAPPDSPATRPRTHLGSDRPCPVLGKWSDDDDAPPRPWPTPDLSPPARD